MELYKTNKKLRYHMSTNTKKERQSPYYVCPVCKQSLTPATNGLCCQQDGVEYSVKNGIPDFVTDDLTKSASVVLRSVDKLDDLAEIYEGPSYYGVLDMANAELGLPSIEEGAKTIAEMVDAKGGVGLDALWNGIRHQTLSPKDATRLRHRHLHGNAGAGDRVRAGERGR